MSFKVVLSKGRHRDKEVVILRFPKDVSLTKVISSNYETRWSETMRSWYVPASQFELNTFIKLMKGKAWVDYTGFNEVRTDQKTDMAESAKPEKIGIKEVPENITEKLTQFRKWMKHRRYSESTVNTYADAVKQFLMYYSNRDIKSLSNDDMVEYVHERIVNGRLSFSYQNQLINGVKLFFREVEKSKIEIDKLQRPLREHKLPNVLSTEEVKAILTVSKNQKHKAMLSLIYACGLRRSELLNLKLSDIDSKRGMLTIRNAKGRKDRLVPISGKVIEMLRNYYKAYRPGVWLFEGLESGTNYSEESLSKVLKNAVRLGGINKPVTLHWLRHSYATHMLENGVDLRYIQELLGHKSSRTTEIYTHVSIKSLQKIKSPFDDL